MSRYGVSPSVNISHSKIPNDHLQQKHTLRLQNLISPAARTSEFILWGYQLLKLLKLDVRQYDPQLGLQLEMTLLDF